MFDETAFSSFIRRIRAGDEQAARELVERYEPVIRREVKMRLRDPRLNRRLDWTDICQSVMASFFVRVASGQYDLDQPAQLSRLLVVMTRHNLSKQQRRHRADKRDYRLLEERDQVDLEGRPGASPTPSRVVAGRELLEAFRAQLSEEERMLADLRAQGCEWAEICTQLGGTPQGRRMQLARAVSQRYNIAQSRVTTHVQIATTPTVCPGKYFPTESVLPATKGATREPSARTTWRAVRDSGKTY